MRASRSTITIEPPQPPQKTCAGWADRRRGVRSPGRTAIGSPAPGRCRRSAPRRRGPRPPRSSRTPSTAPPQATGVDASDRAGVAVTAGRRDLGAPPRTVRGSVRRGRTAERCARRSSRDRLSLPGDCRRRNSSATRRPRRVQADVEVGAERAGDLVPEEGAQRPPVDAPQDLPLQVPLGDGVVAGRRPRLPPRRLRLEALDDGVPVVERLAAIGGSNPDRPAVWLMTWRTSTPSLPFCANSGQ